VQQNRRGLDFLPSVGPMGRLDQEATQSLASLHWTRSDVRSGDFIRADEGISVIGAGWAAQYRDLPEGGRQMVSLLLPGDLCSFAFLTERELNSAPLTALTPTTIWSLPIEAFLGAGDARNSVVTSVLAAMDIDHAILEEHLIAIGSLNAVGRLARFLCELQYRLGATDAPFELPLSQSRIGEYLCLSSVHVNRTFQALRRQGLIETRGKRLVILDAARLAALGAFNAAYLAHDSAAMHSGGSLRSASASSASLVDPSPL